MSNRIETQTESIRNVHHQTAHRQIAILLDSLPERTHDVLLGQLSHAETELIGDELLSLGEVDAMEQYRVLKLMREQLQVETQSVASAESEIRDEIQIGRARVSKKRTAGVYASKKSNNGETPAPAAAPDASAASDSDRRSETSVGDTTNDRTRPVGNLHQFHQTQAAGVLSASRRNYDDLSPDATGFGVDFVGIRNPTQPVETLAQEDCPDAIPISIPVAADPKAELAARIDDYLIGLPPEDFCRALASAATKDVFLVLCGLPNDVSEQTLQMLPRRQAKKVRAQMRRMGRLHLSEIDAAKQRLVQISLRLSAEDIDVTDRPTPARMSAAA